MGMRVKMEFRQRLAGVAFLLICAVAGIWAQGNVNIPIPYSCSFEDPAENANWVSVSTTQNDWKVGDEEKFDGDSSIYVFHRSGSQEVIGANNEANYMSLYRVVTLERGTEYEISFNWKNPGYGNAEMYVCWVPDTVNIPLYSSGTYDMPSWVKERRMALATREERFLTKESLRPARMPRMSW